MRRCMLSVNYSTKKNTVKIKTPTELACMLLPAIFDWAACEIPDTLTMGQFMIPAICFDTGTLCSSNNSLPWRYLFPSLNRILEHPVVRVGIQSTPHFARLSGFWLRSATIHDGYNSPYRAAPWKKKKLAQRQTPKFKYSPDQNSSEDWGQYGWHAPGS